MTAQPNPALATALATAREDHPLHFALASTAGCVAHARITVASIAAVAPDATVMVLDADGSYEPFNDERVLSGDDVGVAALELHSALVLLDPPDLACLFAALTLRVALREVDVAVWLAPGVRLFEPPHSLVSAAATHGLGVVPVRSGRSTKKLSERHSAPRPRLHSLATEMVAVGRGAEATLDQWEAWATARVAGDDWVDATAACQPHGIVQDEFLLLTANSLSPDQTVTLDAASRHVSVDGHVVTAIDLSRFDPQTPWVLDSTRAPDDDPPLRLSDHPALAELCRRDAAALLAARTTPAVDPGPTPLAVPIHPQLRRLFRDATNSWREGRGSRPPDPLDPSTHDALVRWLLEPADDYLPDIVTRYLASIYDARPDLKQTFPFVPGHQTRAFLRWVATHAAGEDDYDAELVTRSVEAAAAGGGRPLSRPRRRWVHPHGVNLVGFLQGEFGIGESARLMLAALTTAEIPHSTLTVRQMLQSRQSEHLTAAPASSETFDITLMCINADLTPTIARSLPASYQGSYRIGMWYWEAEDFPSDQRAGFDYVDEIWVATDFVRDAIAPHSPVPVTTVPPPLPQPQPPGGDARERLGLPDGPIFLFVFDYLSTAGRKNPWGVVEAFRRAFSPGQGPVLVIKSINADQRFADAERLRLLVGDAPDIVLLEDYLGSSDRDALMSACDCYVSLHRSEGLGLTMAEAMSLGKPVIATAYSGNLQFMTEANSYLVPWTRTRIGAGNEPYPAAGTWADPDLDAAAAFMKQVVDDPSGAAARGAQGALDIRTHFSTEAVGAAIAARLHTTRSGTWAARLSFSARALRRAARRASAAGGRAFVRG